MKAYNKEVMTNPKVIKDNKKARGANKAEKEKS